MLKIFGSVIEAVVPVKSQPCNVLFDSVNVLNILLGGVGVVHSQVADSVVFFCGAEVDANRLCVTNVKISVRLGRKTGVNAFSLISAALGDILVNKIVNEVTGHNLICICFSHIVIPLYILIYFIKINVGEALAASRT